MSQAETVKNDLEALLGCPEDLRKATGFSISGRYIQHGNSCDSSEFASLRYEFVEQAFDEFLEENKKNILNRAAELAEECIKPIKEQFSEKQKRKKK